MRESTENERKQAEQIERLRAELDEYIRAEEVMVAAGLVSKDKVDQAHDIVRNFK